jgi:hypothetical protein
MVPVASLWMPILLSAVFVFVVSSVIHMVFTYHRNDLRQLPNEDAVRAAMGPLKIPPGDFIVPYSGTHAAMKDPGFQAKVTAGPVAFLTVLPNEMPGMGKSLTLWFLNSILISVFAAYVAGRALGPGVSYLEVFRFTGTVAFAGYSLALIQNSIWYHRNWGATIRSMADGLIYALFTAGTFGWLWP